MPLSAATLAELTSDDAQTRERAALAAYDTPTDAAAPQPLVDAVQRSVELGNRSAAALLLLARVDAPEAAKRLRELRAEVGQKGAKLREYGPAVPLTLVIDVALARLRDPQASERIAQLLPDAAEAERRFLLQVLGDVTSPALLRALGSWLDDSSSVPDGVPSGASPTRRVADATLDALVQRLALQPSFALRPSARYSEPEIAEVKRLIEKSTR